MMRRIRIHPIGVPRRVTLQEPALGRGINRDGLGRDKQTDEAGDGKSELVKIGTHGVPYSDLCDGW